MAIEFEFGLLADHAIVERSGKLYISGEFANLYTPSMPVIHGHMVAVARWAASKSAVGTDEKCQVEVVDPDGQTVLERSPEIPLRFGPPSEAEPDHMRAQIVVALDQLQLKEYGTHVIQFWVNKKRNGSIRFHVIEPKKAPAR